MWTTRLRVPSGKTDGGLKVPIQIEIMEECMTWHHIFRVKSQVTPNTFYTVTMAGPEGAPHCTCRSFKYSGSDCNCKHIEQVYREGCFWHQQWSDEELVIKGQCPKCGGQTHLVRVAV